MFGNNHKTTNENPSKESGSKLSIFNTPGLINFGKISNDASNNIFSKNVQGAN